MKLTTERLKYLLFLYDQQKNNESMTILSRKIGVDKSTFSRVLATFYQEGLISVKGKSELSSDGLKIAKQWKEDVHQIRHCLSCLGTFTYEEGYEEALSMVVNLSNQGRQKLVSASYLNILFDNLQDIKQIDGDLLGLYLQDGEYPFSFTIYKDYQSSKTVSMANDAFLHPGKFIMENGKGRFYLTTCEVERQIMDGKLTVKGHLSNLEYLEDNEFIQLYSHQNQYQIPIQKITFYYSKEERMLQASLYLKIHTDIGCNHKSENKVIMTIIFK